MKPGEWDRFRKDIAGPLKRRSKTDNERGMATLQALLRAILLRRTKQSKIHGQPILQLPPKQTREDRVPFDKDQREFYFALEESAQVQMNKCELTAARSILTLPSPCLRTQCAKANRIVQISSEEPSGGTMQMFWSCYSVSAKPVVTRT
jgi:SNF2 family DNA or RNA helicase